MKSAARDGCLVRGQFLRMLEPRGLQQDVPVDNGLVVERFYHVGTTHWGINLTCDHGGIKGLVPTILVSLAEESMDRVAVLGTIPLQDDIDRDCRKPRIKEIWNNS